MLRRCSSILRPPILRRSATAFVPRWLSSSDRSYPPHTLFPMPALSPTMVTGSIASWKIDVGQSFVAGDALCAIETDKAAVDFEAQDDGVLAAILVPALSQEVPIGTPICVVVDEASDVAAFANYQVSAAAPTVATTTPSVETASPSRSPPPATTSSTTAVLFPSARFLAESHGKDATGLAPGSGKGGRVTKADVQAALSSLPPLPKHAAVVAPTVVHAAPIPVVAPPTTTSSAAAMDVVVPYITDPTATYQDVPNNKMRKIIATRLTASKREVPHCYVSMEIVLDDVLRLRKAWQKDHQVKISVNDFILKAAALALRDVPHVNRSFDDTTQSIQAHGDNIDVSVAVATPTGLITPIVFQAAQLGLAEVARTVADLAARAKAGQLQPHEYQGGTFSLSNLGMFGVQEFAAVINPPQAAILAVGGGTPVMCPSGADHGDPITRSILTARLSADARVVDEPTAARFLQVLRAYLEQPTLLML